MGFLKTVDVVHDVCRWEMLYMWRKKYEGGRVPPYAVTREPGWYLTFSKMRKRLMTRLTQYIINPMPTRMIRTTWWSQILSPTPPRSGRGVFRWGIWLYHDVDDGEAQGTREVKKLSKHKERAADHAQTNRTSVRVWASLLEVFQRPRGRPKYSR